MDGALYIGAVGLDAQQQALNVVANNVANINTTAFKRQMVQFVDLVSGGPIAGDPALANANSVGAGVAVTATPRDWSQGPLSQTGQPLDLAIQGDGFLEILGPAGSDLLWRGGTLTVNSEGFLATPEGDSLRAMIAVPQGAQNLTIAPNGIVSAQENGASRQLGKLEIAVAKDPASITDAGSGYFQATDPSDVLVAKPGEEGAGTFVQGALETSNVQLTDEMVNMMLVERAYGAAAQVVQAGDQLLSIVNNLRR